MSNKIYIFDTTLRDGEQVPGCQLTTFEKIHIAKELELLGVDIDVRDLPMDGGAGTFDTVGASLFMSSDQFEQYLTLGRHALDEHFARMLPVTALTGGQTFKSGIETELLANKEMAGHLSRLKKDYDRYKQWTAAVDAEAAKPGNTVLVKEVREHPLRTLAIGAAVGAVVAAVIMLRNRDE